MPDLFKSAPGQPNSDTITVEGIVDRVTFENDDTGFRVLRLEVDEGQPLLTVVGKMQRLAEGAHVRVVGRRRVDPRYGEQVQAETVMEVDPSTREGVVRYLGSGLLPGIGPGLAKRIVEKFGDDTLSVLDEDPSRLLDVPGIGARRVDAMVKAWTEQRVLREIMVFLQAHGISASLAARIVKRYGNDAIRIVKDNPYRLALDVWGIGFLKADAIARHLGIGPEAPERIRAGLLHVLDRASTSGHVLLPESTLIAEAMAVLQVDQALIEDGLQRAVLAGEIRREELDELGTVTYRARSWQEERGLAEGLMRLAKAPVRKLGGVERAVRDFERVAGAVLSEQQRQAVELAASRAVLVVTGGPGVGKTTVLRAVLNLFLSARLVVKLVAPTGRASRRMSEATAHEALTIHRLLEVNGRTGGFQRDEKNPVDADVVVVDEASMLDQRLGFALVRALRTGTRLLLVGDVDQLPSVGPGAVLKDVLDSGVVASVRLTQVFRQAEQSLIVRAAHRIRQGRSPEPTPPGPPLSDFYLINVRSAEVAVDRVLKLVTDRIPSQFHLDPVRDVQVLCPMRKGVAGTEALNKLLQERLNPNGARVSVGSRTYRVGDKVMQLRNDYQREIFNGDVGFVRDIDQDEGKLKLEMDGRDVSCDGSQVDELVLAYACSIHKSQGSEYPAVVIPMLSSHFVMLSRNLLYTAVTRGKKLVVLVTDDRALRLALTETRKEDRYTYLFKRLAQLSK